MKRRSHEEVNKSRRSFGLSNRFRGLSWLCRKTAVMEFRLESGKLALKLITDARWFEARQASDTKIRLKSYL